MNYEFNKQENWGGEGGINLVCNEQWQIISHNCFLHFSLFLWSQCFWVFFSVWYFWKLNCFVTGNIRDILGSAMHNHTEFRRKMDAVTHFMQMFKVGFNIFYLILAKVTAALPRVIIVTPAVYPRMVVNYWYSYFSILKWIRT